MTEHRGWHNRGYLPHFDGSKTNQIITYHLADSLPRSALDRMATELETIPDDDKQTLQKRKHLEQLMDAGHGSCVLADPVCAKIVQDAWQHFHTVRYNLLAWVVIPNHVHVMIQEYDGHSLSDVISSWKSFTAKAINRHLGRSGQIWHLDYWDRYIRDEQHFDRAVQYIINNPVTAKLCTTPEQWPWTGFRDPHQGSPLDPPLGSRPSRPPGL